MRCLYREITYISGRYVDTAIFPVWAKKAGTRKARYKATSEDQQRINRRNAAMKVTRLMNANFTEHDLKVELTYREEDLPEDEEEAKRDIHNFFRRMRRALAKLGKELKYLYCIEGSRYHYHMAVTGGLSVQEISKLWGKGYIKVAGLEFDRDQGLAAFANYLTKNPRFYKSYVASRNLIRPEPEVRTGVLRQRDVEQLAELTDCRDVFAEIYRDVNVAEAESRYDRFNQKFYINLYGTIKTGGKHNGSDKHKR